MRVLGVRHGQDSRSCLGLARLASLGLDHETETTLVKTTRLASYVSKVSKVNYFIKKVQTTFEV